MSDNQTTASIVRTDDSAALRVLATRLLAGTRPDDDGPGEIDLLVGRLPDPLPFDVPLPERSRIAGSAVSADYVNIVLDVDMSPEEARSFYQERMPAAGWTESEPFDHGQGGFISARPNIPLTFCRGARDPWVAIRIGPGHDGVTDVRVDLNLDARYSPYAARRGRRAPLFSRIPTLAPPPGARQNSEGASAGDDRAHATALLETDLALPAVAAHYSAHLEGSGWARRDEGASGPGAWSLWTFQDEDGDDWRGEFIILKDREPRQYFLLVRVTLDTDDAGPGNGGWVSASGTQ